MPDYIFNNTALSNFAAAGRFDILGKRYRGHAFTTIEVGDELRRGLKAGYTYLESAWQQLESVNPSGWLRILGQEIHIPFQRTPRAVHFTNRQSELEQLLKNLQPGQVATLCRPGGIGKSALAAEAIWRLTAQNRPTEQFPDGIIFHSFYNQPQAALAMENIALAFGEEPHPPHEMLPSAPWPETSSTPAARNRGRRQSPRCAECGLLTPFISPYKVAHNNTHTTLNKP